MNVTQIQVKNLYGLCLWVKDKNRRGQALNHSQIDQAAILDMLEKLRYNKLDSEATVNPPLAFEPVNWVK